MNRRIRLWLALMAAGLGLAALAAPVPGPAPRPSSVPSTTAQGTASAAPLVPEGPAPDLAILYTGNVVGYVEPCG
jgi:hypothetical protein